MSAIDWIDVKSKYGLSPDSPEVKAAAATYEKELKTISASGEALAKKATTEKDPKKRKALEDSAQKTHQAGLIKLRRETETVLSKIPVLAPPRRIQGDHAQGNGTFTADLQKLKLSDKDPEVQTAFSMYNKGVDAVTGQANNDLTKASTEKNAKKRVALEQGVMKFHQDGLLKLRAETRAVLAKIKPKNS